MHQFKSEARILHHLRHPNLPRVYDFFEDDGRHYLVMDYIEGQTLEAMLENGPLSEAQVGEVARTLCEVLAYMHAQRPPVIFRDLKPANVMVETSGHLKLIDFGIAKMFEASEQNRTHTLIRSAGTPGFAAPEQYGAGTDERSDIYSLGATLYCCITGVTPPALPSLAVEATFLARVRDMSPEVSPTLAATIEHMMQPAPAKRPQSMAQVRQLLKGSPMASLSDWVQPQVTEFETDHPTHEMLMTEPEALQPAPSFRLSGRDPGVLGAPPLTDQRCGREATQELPAALRS